MQSSEQLQFGPYSPPQLKIGDRILDENRGMAQVVGLSDGRIPWPIVTSVLNKRARSLALYGDLVRAVQNESGAAIRYWWGVSLTGVTTWRKALGVPRSNPGSYELWRRSCAGSPWQKARAAAIPVLQSPEYSAKRMVLAAMYPRPKPTNATLRRMRLAQLGKNRQTPESLSRKLATLRANGSCCGRGRLWSEADDKILWSWPVAAAAEKLGRSLQAVYKRRQKLGLAVPRKMPNRKSRSKR